jgi:hypothetical protein
MASQSVAVGVPVRKIGNALVTGANSSVQDLEFARSTFTVHVKYSGTITTASIQLQASPDGGTTWHNLGTAYTTTTDGAFSVTGVAAQIVRVSVTISGGGNATLFLAAA